MEDDDKIPMEDDGYVDLKKKIERVKVWYSVFSW